MKSIYQPNQADHARSAWFFSPSSPQRNRSRRVWAAPILLLCGALIFLAGCGPEQNSAGNGDPAEQTLEIARTYATSGDIETARRQLGELDVANGNQWLVYVAESAVAENSDPATTQALVQLAHDLGLESAELAEYARGNGEPEAAAVIQANQAVDITPPAALVPTATAMEEAAVAGVTEATAADATVADASAAEAVAADNTDAVTETAAITETAALPEPTQSPTPASAPAVRATLSMNVRNGPGVEYGIVGALNGGEELVVTGKSPDGAWWQVELPDGVSGWVYGQLVEAVGSMDSVAVAANIPPAPQPTATVPPAEPEPATPPPAEAEPAPPAADPASTPHFTLVSRRLWSKEENGGCRGQHLLRIIVTDANGIRLNGVALQGIYIGEVLVTGDQGKGDGVIEYDLHGSGEGFFVLRNDDGRDVTSDRAEGFTTRSLDIPKDLLIQTGYCSDSADCDVFYSSFGCQGHHSYEAIFQRNY